MASTRSVTLEKSMTLSAAGKLPGMELFFLEASDSSSDHIPRPKDAV